MKKLAVLLLLAAAPARADLILPPDFLVMRAWTLNRCETYAGLTTPAVPAS